MSALGNWVSGKISFDKWLIHDGAYFRDFEIFFCYWPQPQKDALFLVTNSKLVESSWASELATKSAFCLSIVFKDSRCFNITPILFLEILLFWSSSNWSKKAFDAILRIKNNHSVSIKDDKGKVLSQDRFDQSACTPGFPNSSEGKRLLQILK